MSSFIWISSALLLQAVQSYILLTANMEDVQNVAKQLIESPIGGQVQQIFRRAYNVFNHQLVKSRARSRAEAMESDDVHQDNRRAESDVSDFSTEYRRSNDPNEPTKDPNEPSKDTSGLSKDPNEPSEDPNAPSKDTNGTSTDPNEHTKDSKELDGKNELRQKQDELNEVVVLGKNASIYLNKIKKIIENAPV